MKYLNYILIIVGAFVAMYAKTGTDQNQFVLIAGIVLLMIGIYRIARTIPSKNDNEDDDSQDQNPGNDFTNSTIADYLNAEVANLGGPEATAYREHTITQTYVVTLTISDFDLEVISLDVFDFGSLDDSETTDSRTVTPDFP